MPHCFCRVLRRAILIFRIPPPSDTPISGFSATILTTSPRSLSDKSPLAAERYAGVSTTVCRRAHITKAWASMAPASMALNLGSLMPELLEFLEVARETLAARSAASPGRAQ